MEAGAEGRIFVSALNADADRTGRDDSDVRVRTLPLASDAPRMAMANASSFAGAKVLVVDDEPAVHTIMQRLCESVGYIALHAFNGKEALDIVRNDRPDLVMTDVRMPEMDGTELCRRLRSDPATALLPVLMLSSLAATQEKVEGLDSGADEYLTKPFQRSEVLARLRAMLRIKRLQDQLEDAEHVIFSFARAVEAKDIYTAGHVERVSSLALGIGRHMGMEDGTLAELFRGGVLHDIGKIGVPDSILNKPSSLTPMEFEVIKQHTVIGDRICQGLKSLEHVRDLVRHHHEKLDGTGYPDRLTGDRITIGARIMAVCDVYDALTSTRAYRPAMPTDAALTILREGAAAGQWDGEVVRALEAVLNK